MSDVLIIGGGVAGLSSGIYSLREGNRVTICEKHSIPGGNLTGWNRAGYAIDNCIHWLTGTNPVTNLYKVWHDLGALGTVPMVQPETLFTVEDQGATVSLHRHIEDTVQEMLAVSPEDRKEILAFGRAVNAFMKIQGTYGPNNDDKIPAHTKIASIPALFRYYPMTTGQLADRFKSPLLRQFFNGSLMGHDFGAFAFIMTAATFCGGNGDVPEGGSVPMAKRMTQKFLDLGGQLRCPLEAKKINVADGRAQSVLFSNGETIPADYVVVTADPDMVFGKMLDAPMPRRLKKQYDKPGYNRFSSYGYALAYDGEGVDYEGDLIVDVPEEYQELTGADSFMLREFADRKNAAPKGKTLLQSMTLCTERTCQEFIALAKDRQAYHRYKDELGQAIVKSVERKLPQMEGKLSIVDSWTPATYKRYTSSAIGSFMAFTLPARKIPRQLSNRVKGVKNVILATQWLQVPGGLPPAALAGKKAAETIAKLSAKGETA